MNERFTRSAFIPAGFFVLRAPRLSFERLVEWQEAANAGAGGGGDRHADRRDGRLRSWLHMLCERPETREALFVASPDLEAQLEKWLAKPASESGRKIERALVRYVSRMAGRATPFGLFSSCSVGTIGQQTSLELGAHLSRHIRLDMDYVAGLADALTRDPRLRPHLHFTPNSSLYSVAGRIRYLEIRRDGKRWSHHRSSLVLRDYLQVVLERASGTGATIGELAEALVAQDPDASAQEAGDYVEELIEQQMLVSELAPGITGREPVQCLIERLGQLPHGAVAATTVASACAHLRDIGSCDSHVEPARYRAVAQTLAALPAPVDASRLFQVDLVRDGAEPVLGENVMAELARSVELLRTVASRPDHDPLGEFREAFRARFGDTPITREVPLTEALDDETGVGFGEGAVTVEASSLLEDAPSAQPPNRRVSWGARETFLLGRVTAAIAAGEHELKLTEQDLAHLANPEPLAMPDAFAVAARIEASSAASVDRGEFRIFLASVTGPSGARLMGRFCHADPHLARCVESHIRAEEAMRPDAMFAEIVHLPEGRVGNILVRPLLRSHEIAYAGRSGAPAEQQIPLSDLRVSVRGSRVVLRSAKLDREVLPRLSNAHNFMAGHGFYTFLCALQSQNVAGALGWDWGPLADSVFLPRLVYSRTVLARAQWRVTKREIESLVNRDAQDQFAATQVWRAQRNLPRWICLADFDNELVIDLDNELMVHTLLAEIKQREHATLIELFPSPQKLCAGSTEGSFMHEIIVPFTCQRPVQRGGVAGSRKSNLLRRRFPPGSEWLTVHVYGGAITIDELVHGVVGPVASELVSRDDAQRWFFLRYADPHSHLRIRFRGDVNHLEREVLPRLQKVLNPFINDGRIWRIRFGMYEREIERYGGEAGIELCEQLFHHDSEAVVRFLQSLDDDSRGDTRWRITLLGMDRMLQDLGLTLKEKRDLLRRLRQHEDLSPRSSPKFRAEAAALVRLLNADDISQEWATAHAILDERSQRNALAARLLRQRDQHGQLTASIPDIAASLLHMHANRMLRSSLQMQERVLYDYLFRIYESQAQRDMQSEDVEIQRKPAVAT